MNLVLRAVITVLLSAVCLGASEPLLKPPLVIVAIFEVGADPGDRPTGALRALRHWPAL